MYVTTQLARDTSKPSKAYMAAAKTCFVTWPV